MKHVQHILTGSDVLDMVNYAAFDVNPCFDIYEVVSRPLA